MTCIVAKSQALTFSWRRSLSYRNQSIDLYCKSMDWLLYDKDLCHKGLKNMEGFFVQFFLFCFHMRFKTLSKIYKEVQLFRKIVNGLYPLIHFFKESPSLLSDKALYKSLALWHILRFNILIKKQTDFGLVLASHPVEREDLQQLF